ncbi:GntR family transcriptional regulator [Pseudomonas putida]|uniref:GntR family transcriptional regulator n=1 Tax=Pseudomonas TaxID=286 RepID=UPI000ADEFD2F|nr:MULTISPECIES: GntR family transcriptional regulator [unclassified Pseudomonas]MBI6940612.1 GntR family transcriptional regulator [Pseudomonas putida]MBI6956810.1 GntR family transcriptional regulator [Pseudomonas putida]
MSAGHKIKRQSIPETLAESLRERILNGEFKGGEPLIQEAIAAEYGVSRMPVREAFRQLEAAGLIVFQVHKGAIVTSIPEEQISELFDLRALLECELLERSIPAMSDEQLAVAREILPRLEEAYHRRDVSSWGTLNWEFHKSLYAAADRVQTLAVAQGINLQTERYVRLQLLLTDAVEDAEVDHREILRLCEAKDVERAVVYLRKHILDAGRQLRDALKKHEMTSA